jgi:peroxiredoxin
MIVHVWGACQPTDCDWGEAEAAPWNGIPLVIWKQGFATTRMQLVPQPDRRLLLVYRFEYHDASGRRDLGHAEFFTRSQTKPEAADSAAARTLLNSVAAAYRSLAEARFESTETVNRLTGKVETRTETSRILLFTAPDHLRVETRGSAEESIIVADGTTEWQIFPQSNEYTRVPQPSHVLSTVLSYPLLDRSRGTPRILAHQQFEGTGCTVVQIDLGKGITRKLWIDATTHLVRADSYDELPAASNGAARKSMTVYTMLQSSEKPDPALFAYDPAKTQAQNRRQLSREAPVSLRGKPAPEFTLRDINGRKVSLADARGKVVLLDFWGAWCGYCREALPSVDLLYRNQHDKGLTVFGIDAEAPELAKEYLMKYGYTFPSLSDPYGAVAARYHVTGWPTTVLIDREGNVAYYQEGTESEKLHDALIELRAW